MPHLPAAVEVAAYRIAQEALTNLVRHAHARHCTVRLAMNGGLELEVIDDGKGLPARHAVGVGLASMRERAAELGGTCTVRRGPDGGTIVRAELPVPEPSGAPAPSKPLEAPEP
jgi:two-component system NarL family sensor kinase